jgi:exosortase
MNLTLNIRRNLAIALAALSFAVLFHQVIYEMVLDWYSNENYSHGFLIPFISGYLIWQDRRRLSGLPIKPHNSGFFMLVFSCLFFMAANIGAELFTTRLSLLMILFSSAVFLAGWPMARALSCPIGYLIFMIPLPAIIWNKIAFPLKLFATHMAVCAISAANIPVFGEGNIIHLANTTLQVVDACSGLRSLTSLLALSAAFALITNHSKVKKVVLFLSAVPIAILLNIVRLFMTAVLASRFGPQVAQGFLHELSGLLVFSLALVLTYLVHLLLLRMKGHDT